MKCNLELDCQLLLWRLAVLYFVYLILIWLDKLLIREGRILVAEKEINREKYYFTLNKVPSP